MSSPATNPSVAASFSHPVATAHTANGATSTPGLVIRSDGASNNALAPKIEPQDHSTAADEDEDAHGDTTSEDEGPRAPGFGKRALAGSSTSMSPTLPAIDQAASTSYDGASGSGSGSGSESDGQVVEAGRSRRKMKSSKTKSGFEEAEEHPDLYGLRRSVSISHPQLQMVRMGGDDPVQECMGPRQWGNGALRSEALPHARARPCIHSLIVPCFPPIILLVSLGARSPLLLLHGPCVL